MLYCPCTSYDCEEAAPEDVNRAACIGGRDIVDCAELVTLLPPADVEKTLRRIDGPVSVVMLDPWYNKGIGGHRDDYDD